MDGHGLVALPADVLVKARAAYKNPQVLIAEHFTVSQRS